MSADSDDSYGLSGQKEAVQISPPQLDYLPHKPVKISPKIGLIGAGGITTMHLAAYKELGLDVVAISNRTLPKAEKLKDQFYPGATVYSDYNVLLNRDDIEIVDVATHVDARPEIIRAALNRGKHVLSQKPFVTDLEEGQKLIDLANEKGLKLAVNQNGRWAPHFSYMREAVSGGLLGKVNSVQCSSHWDHLWIQGLPNFENMRHVVLFDFCVHWFDIITCFMGGQKATQIYASKAGFKEQAFKPDAIASVIMEYPEAQVCMHFHSHTTLGEEDTTTIRGAEGLIRCRATGLNNHSEVDLFTEKGNVTVSLEGDWFTNGFEGTMSELLSAIAEDRQPSNSAASNLIALEACFAALKSADTGLPVVPGTVTKIESY